MSKDDGLIYGKIQRSGGRLAVWRGFVYCDGNKSQGSYIDIEVWGEQDSVLLKVEEVKELIASLQEWVSEVTDE